MLCMSILFSLVFVKKNKIKNTRTMFTANKFSNEVTFIVTWDGKQIVIIFLCYDVK